MYDCSFIIWVHLGAHTEISKDGNSGMCMCVVRALQTLVAILVCHYFIYLQLRLIRYILFCIILGHVDFILLPFKHAYSLFSSLSFPCLVMIKCLKLVKYGSTTQLGEEGQEMNQDDLKYIISSFSQWESRYHLLQNFYAPIATKKQRDLGNHFIFFW